MKHVSLTSYIFDPAKCPVGSEGLMTRAVPGSDAIALGLGSNGVQMEVMRESTSPEGPRDRSTEHLLEAPSADVEVQNGRAPRSRPMREPTEVRDADMQKNCVGRVRLLFV